MSQSFIIDEIFKVEPSVIFSGWLDSDIHSKMTGAEANYSNYEDGRYVAWGGYIFGKVHELVLNRKIVLTFRTMEYTLEDQDSVITIEFEPVPEGTKLTLFHYNIPHRFGLNHFKQGWIDYYFAPMKYYFEGEQNS